MSIKRNEAGKIIAKKFTMKRLERAAANQEGFCLACGAAHDGIEPDARRYTCDSCGMNYVYGAEELALMGRGK
jgi:transposase-like protein